MDVVQLVLGHRQEFGCTAEHDHITRLKQGASRVVYQSAMCATPLNQAHLV
jgi:hypothetical protein